MRMALAMVCLMVGASRSAAELLFTAPAVDFGQVGSGKVLEREFACMNKGDHPLEIVETKASCGCMQPMVEPRTLQPRQSGRIIVRINTLQASAGRQWWTVQVRYRENDLVHETVLTLKADVVQEVLVQPPALTISTDAPVQQQMVVTDMRPQPLRIRKLETSAPHLQAFLAGEEQSPSGKPVYTIHVRVSPETRPGRHEDHLIIHTDDADYPQLVVPVTLTMRSKQRMTALPSSVEWILGPDQQKATRLVTLRDSQLQTHIIDSASTDHPALTVTFSQGPSKVGTVKIVVDRSKVQGPSLKAQVRVSFREPEGEKLIIPVYCELR